MLPDFPFLKRQVARQLLRFVHSQIPIVEPILRDVSAFSQHEGKQGEMVRADGSMAAIKFRRAGHELEIPREEMRRLDVHALRAHLIDIAEQLGGQQVQRMLAQISEAAEASGNSIATGGELKPEDLIEAMKRVEVEFDAVTGERKPGFKFVTNTETATKLRLKVEEWEKDPRFKEALAEAENQQREGWRAREASRKLVD